MRIGTAAMSLVLTTLLAILGGCTGSANGGRFREEQWGGVVGEGTPVFRADGVLESIVLRDNVLYRLTCPP